MGPTEDRDSSTYTRLLGVYAGDLLKEKIAALRRSMRLALAVALVSGGVAVACFLLGWTVAALLVFLVAGVSSRITARALQLGRNARSAGLNRAFLDLWMELDLPFCLYLRGFANTGDPVPVASGSFGQTWEKYRAPAEERVVELLKGYDIPVFKLHNLDDAFPERDQWAIRAGALDEEWESLIHRLLTRAALVVMDPHVHVVGSTIPMVAERHGWRYAGLFKEFFLISTSAAIRKKLLVVCTAEERPALPFLERKNPQAIRIAEAATSETTPSSEELATLVERFNDLLESAGAEFEPAPHFVEIADRKGLQHADFSLPEDVMRALSEARDRAVARNLSVRLAANVTKVTPATLLSYRNWKANQLEVLLTGAVRHAESGTEIEVPSVIVSI